MGQILLNLLSNAIKFTPAGGTVSVRVRQFAGTVRDCAQYEFRVRDNGIGMSPEFAQKIFEPFERERTSTVSRIQGTGRHGHHPECRRDDGRHDQGAD
ncbi:MAG: sensor histidine kinase [Butyricicoccus sp.]